MNKYNLYEDKTIDRYIRSNPRRNAKCSPYLWGDKYNFQENFANLSNNKTQNVNMNKINDNRKNKNRNIISNNDKYEDNYYYLGNKKDIYNYQESNQRFNTKCENKVYKIKEDMTLLNMVDIDHKLLMKKNILGNKNEIDNLHNNMNMNYDILNKEIKNNSLVRLTNETNLNPSLMNMRTKRNLDDEFFTSPVNKNYFVPPSRICRKNDDLGKYF